MSTSQHHLYAPQYARRRQQSQAAATAAAAAAPPPLRRAASFFMSRAAASSPRSPRWSDAKWNFLGSTRYLMPSTAAAAALITQPHRTRLTVSNMVKPTIQFIRGVDELSVPDVSLTRSKDGLNGVATFTFDQPSVFDSSKELGDITGLYLVDEEGVLTSVDVSAKFLNGKPAKIEAKYVMKNVSEWDRFMRFMERYATANNLGFVKK